MTSNRVRATIVGLLLSTALVSGCAENNSNLIRDLENYTPEQIFERGEYELSTRDYEQGAYYFSEIERLYPYSEWSKRALIMQAFAHHQETNYEASRAAAQRYIDFFPADQDAAYAQYLLALSYYDQIEDVGRDQGVTFQALQSLRVVIEHYPDSDYAPLAVARFDLAFDHLAAKEMEVGRYYLRRKIAAAAWASWVRPKDR